MVKDARKADPAQKSPFSLTRAARKRFSRFRWLLVGWCGWLLFGFGTASGGVLVTALYSFSGSTDGCFPWAGLVQGSDGNLYGTTAYGGARNTISGFGTVYQLALDGTFTSLYQFANNGDGDHPDFAGLVEGSDGFFYGTTLIGGDYGNGEIFAMTSDGALLPIYSFYPFGDGSGPDGGLALGADGSIYGTTSSGGAYGFGSVFSLDLNWNYTDLFSFNGTNGAFPMGQPVLASDGNLYGTTFNGGSSFNGLDASGNATGYGTIFRVTTNGAVISLFSFSGANGAQPFGGLVQGKDGKLYGATAYGGAADHGTVFAMDTNAVFNALFSFTGTNGAYPAGKLVQAQDGNFYGTTADVAFYNGGSRPSVGDGTIFRMTPSGQFSKIYSFPGRPGGGEPTAGLVLATNGIFYGTCSGGEYSCGMIFSLSIPAPPVLQIPLKSPDGLILRWSAVAGQSYQLQYTSHSSSGPWNSLGNPVTAANGQMSLVDPAPLQQNRFYRVMLLP